MSGHTPSRHLQRQNAILGVGEVAVSNNASVTISTYALGSCVAVVAYDKPAGVGGIIHIMLPDSRLSPERAAQQPAMFADTGLPLMLKSMKDLKAKRDNIRAFVAGGASVIAGSDMFKVGERNILRVQELARSLAIPVIKTDIGGVNNRSLQLEIATGIVTLKTVQGISTIDLS